MRSSNLSGTATHVSPCNFSSPSDDPEVGAESLPSPFPKIDARPDPEERPHPSRRIQGGNRPRLRAALIRRMILERFNRATSGSRPESRRTSECAVSDPVCTVNCSARGCGGESQSEAVIPPIKNSDHETAAAKKQ